MVSPGCGSSAICKSGGAGSECWGGPYRFAQYLSCVYGAATCNAEALAEELELVRRLARFRRSNRMHSPILAPLVALVLWSFVMWAWLYATRIPAVVKNKIIHDPQRPNE